MWFKSIGLASLLALVISLSSATSQTLQNDHRNQFTSSPSSQIESPLGHLWGHERQPTDQSQPQQLSTARQFNGPRPAPMMINYGHLSHGGALSHSARSLGDSPTSLATGSLSSDDHQEAGNKSAGPKRRLRTSARSMSSRRRHGASARALRLQRARSLRSSSSRSSARSLSPQSSQQSPVNEQSASSMNSYIVHGDQKFRPRRWARQLRNQVPCDCSQHQTEASRSSQSQLGHQQDSVKEKINEKQEFVGAALGDKLAESKSSNSRNSKQDAFTLGMGPLEFELKAKHDELAEAKSAAVLEKAKAVGLVDDQIKDKKKLQGSEDVVSTSNSEAERRLDSTGIPPMNQQVQPSKSQERTGGPPTFDSLLGTPMSAILSAMSPPQANNQQQQSGSSPNDNSAQLASTEGARSTNQPGALNNQEQQHDDQQQGQSQQSIQQQERPQQFNQQQEMQQAALDSVFPVQSGSSRSTSLEFPPSRDNERDEQANEQVALGGGQASGNGQPQESSARFGNAGDLKSKVADLIEKKVELIEDKLGKGKQHEQPQEHHLPPAPKPISEPYGGEKKKQIHKKPAKQYKGPSTATWAQSHPLYQSPLVQSLPDRCLSSVRVLDASMGELLVTVERVGQQVLLDDKVSYMTRDILSRRLAKIRVSAEEARMASNLANLRVLNESARSAGLELMRLANSQVAHELDPSLRPLALKIRKVYGVYRGACKGVPGSSA